MIRILYMSDLHIEMERWRLKMPGWVEYLRRHFDLPGHPKRGPLLPAPGSADLAVLAGDIHVGLRSLVYAEQVAAYLGVKVALVAGNHEYYHQHMDLLEPAFFGNAAHTGGAVAFLENTVASYSINGERLHVLGCTLWTDYALRGDVGTAMDFARTHMNDHRLIRRVSSLFRPEDALARHEKSRAWLHVTLARLRAAEPQAKLVVVTHHAPDQAFLGPRGGRVAASYASGLLEEFAGYGVSAWVHGHTHYRHESEAAGMKVVSAPRGYVMHEGQRALEFCPGILEI
jgi:hypothetical protein